MLYLIEILHQTTTLDTANELVRKLYLIEILHQTTTPPVPPATVIRCILSKFYIKPQQIIIHNHISAVVSYRNSTSNHNRNVSAGLYDEVVSYRNSTSNHNNATMSGGSAPVVSYRNSTSNHNRAFKVSMSLKLYLIEILHQTTTDT